MRRLSFIILILFAGALASYGQGTKDIRINEILVKNVDNYMDDYGHRSSWIELHNTGHSTVDVGGCYLRAVKKDGQEIVYRIPTGDPRSVVGPLGYVVFFCEGTGTKGTLYTNFTLEDISSLALLNASGKGTPLDEVSIDYDRQIPDVSIGMMTLESGEEVFMTLPKTTPNATNNTEPMLPRHERFRQMDPTGVMLTVIAVIVVMSVLLLLFLFFKVLGYFMVKLAKKKVAATAAVKMADGDAVIKSYDSPAAGDEIAAIAMALKMFQEDLHDKESSVITINKVARAYSPWSSKIYGLSQHPNKK